MQTNFINREMGLTQLGSLHERVGEQQLQNTDKTYRTLNSWGRSSSTDSVIQGKKRLGAETRQELVQVGQDIVMTELDSGYARHGLMFSYSWANNRFYDKYHAQNAVVIDDKYVGKGKSKLLSLGAYRTFYGNNNSYLDIVTSFSWLENKYYSERLLRQTGWGTGLSVEVGRHYPVTKQWKLEPQVQLKTQYVYLNDFNDYMRTINSDDHISVQGRFGLRLTNEKFYLAANVLQDIISSKAFVKIGQATVEERYNNSRFEVSLGVNIPFNVPKTLALYGDVKYGHALGSSYDVFSSRNSREHYNGRIGLRYQW